MHSVICTHANSVLLRLFQILIKVESFLGSGELSLEPLLDQRGCTQEISIAVFSLFHPTRLTDKWSTHHLSFIIEVMIPLNAPRWFIRFHAGDKCSLARWLNSCLSMMIKDLFLIYVAKLELGALTTSHVFIWMKEGRPISAINWVIYFHKLQTWW